MNKKLLLGLGSTLILSVPILVATSCGDEGTKSSGYWLINDESDTNKITIRIDGQNLSTNSADWTITETNNNHTSSNVWTLDTTKSNSNSVFFSATKDATKGKVFAFLCNGVQMLSNFSTPLPPTSISSINGQNAFKGYQGSSQNPESSSQNEAIISFADPSSLTVNFEFKNISSTSQTPAQFMKLTLPSQLGNVFENYQGYNQNVNIKWSLKDANSNFEINNNILISTKAIDPTTVQNVTLVGSISMNGWEDTFEIKVNFSNQAQDIQINSVTSKIDHDKVIVTITGSKLPTDSTKWKFKENNTESTEWTLSSSPVATESQVTFEATYANVIGKTFTIEGTGAENTVSKSFAVPISSITNINSDMTNEGNLILTVSGSNLSSTKSLYVFNFVEGAPLASTYANPSIDVDQIDLTWTDSSTIKFTINKQNSQGQVLTKDLYGAKFSLQIKDQTPVTEFTFSDYIAPTAILKDQFFTDVHEGTSNSNITTPVSLDKITGGNLSYTITTSTANDKFVSISLPKSDGSTNIFSFLSGQKGFTTSGNSTTLSWSIPVDQTSNWEYEESTSILKNKNELTTDTNLTIAVTGTITDTITSRAKTFTLNLTLVLYDPNSVINEPTISWVNEAGSEDKGKKIKVTFTGKGLSTNQDDWTIEPNDSSSTLPNWTIDPTSSTTSVSFTIEFNKDTMGKSYTFSVKDIEGTKNVTIPTSTLTDIESKINQNGDLILTFTGDNLSANLDTYIFTYKNSGTATFDGETTTPPTIDETFKQNINVDWTNEKSITLTIQKVKGDGSQNVLTKGLYGLTYEVNIYGQTDKKEFTFKDYQAPTGVTNDIFAESNAGSSNGNYGTTLDKNSFKGNNLEWNITIEDSENKWIKIKFKDSDFLSALVGQLGFGENNNSTTTLKWALKEGEANNSNFTYQSDGLVNNVELTTSGFNVVMVGTLEDTLTNITKTFELKLNIKMTDSPVQTVSSASSEIDTNGDLKILLTGSNLSKDPTKYEFTYVAPENKTITVPSAESTTPTVDSSMLELDNDYTNSTTSVQFIIKKIKDTTPSNPSTYELPTAQTKGLYGQTFSVTSVDTSSNTPSSRVNEQSVTFTFADYVAPTSINSIEFFKKTESATQKGDGEEQEPDFFPLTQSDITQDENKPFEWTITSPYKSHTYIFLDLPSNDEILASIDGWQGFSQNLPSNPDAAPDTSPETYTSVSWKFKDETGHTNFEDLNNNRLYNKEALTESTPISVELTATITDNLTSESVSFDIKITFKLGTLEDPKITAPSQDPKNDTTLNAYEGAVNTNISLTVKGSNLPNDINLWNITDESTSITRASLDEETNNNFGNWEIDSPISNELITFRTTWSNVVGAKIGFAVKGFENSKQIFTMPAPSFANVEETNGALEKGDITFTITGTDLSTDPNIYEFEEVTTTNSGNTNNGNREGEGQNILDPTKYGIKIEPASTGSGENDSQNSIKVTIPKIVAQQYGNGSRYNAKTGTSLISDFYGNNIKVKIKNSTESLTFNIPKYSEPTSIQKGLLGNIWEGSTEGLTQNENATITPDSSPVAYLTKADEKVFDFTITLSDWNSKYVRVDGIKNYNVATSKEGEDTTTSVDFLSYFTGLDGFTDSTHTSLKWALKDESNTTPQPTSLIDIAADTSSWVLQEDGLVNKTEIPNDENGLSTTLIGTLTDLDTNQQVTFEMKITVKRGTENKPTIDENSSVSLSNSNTNVKVTITGTNLPTEFSKWKIEEVTSSQLAEEGGDTSNNNIWSIASNASSTSIEFSAKYIDVVGKNYKFSLVDSPEITTSITCPTPTFSNSNSGFDNNKYDILFTITGTNLPGDIDMYKFSKVSLDSSGEKDLNTLKKEIRWTNNSEVKIIFKKYSEGTESSTLQTKGLYGKSASFGFSNETDSNSHQISFPDYFILGMNKEFLGTISTGENSSSLTTQSGLDINIGTELNNTFPVTITTNSDTAKFIKFELPNNSVTSSNGTTKEDSTNNFLETGFKNWGGFTNSALTSLSWSIATIDNTPPAEGSDEGEAQENDEENDTSSDTTANWSLTDNVLTNTTELTTEGLNVTLTATLIDSETDKQLSFNVNLTVKLGTSSSSGSESGSENQ